VLVSRHHRLVLRGCCGGHTLVKPEVPFFFPAVCLREGLHSFPSRRSSDLGGRDRNRRQRHAGRVVAVDVRCTSFPRRGDGAHISHRPRTLRELRRVHQFHNRYGRQNTDDRHDDQQLNQGETFLVPSHSCPP